MFLHINWVFVCGVILFTLNFLVGGFAFGLSLRETGSRFTFLGLAFVISGGFLLHQIFDPSIGIGLGESHYLFGGWILLCIIAGFLGGIFWPRQSSLFRRLGIR